MDSSLSNRLLVTIRRHQMIAPGDRIVVAVSGGGDSVALLLLMMELREILGITLSVAHFNHQLRTTEAGEDERFVRALAGKFGLPCIARSEDLAAWARSARTNLEAEARDRRYAFLRGIVSQGWATRIATGHTADDQAETVLARLARGTGLTGLRAIHPVLGPVVRPLIEIRRTVLREYLSSRNQPWREDSTNQDTSRLRARIRHRLLPALEAELGPGGVHNLGRLADLARNDDALIDELVEISFLRLARREGSQLTLHAEEMLNAFPGLKTAQARLALASRLVRRAVREVSQNRRGLTADHVARVLNLAHGRINGTTLTLPGGLLVERALDRLIFSSSGAIGRAPREKTSYSYSYFTDPWLNGESIVQIAETGKRLRLKLVDWPSPGRETYPESVGVLDADLLNRPLFVRSRLPGDSYRPRGRMHAEKLKRLLLERRVAGRDRALWPVLTSGGRVAWTIGLPVAADFAVSGGTERALIVREEVGAPGGVESFDVTRTPGNASNQ